MSLRSRFAICINVKKVAADVHLCWVRNNHLLTDELRCFKIHLDFQANVCNIFKNEISEYHKAKSNESKTKD